MQAPSIGRLNWRFKLDIWSILDPQIFLTPSLRIEETSIMPYPSIEKSFDLHRSNDETSVISDSNEFRDIPIDDLRINQVHSLIPNINRSF